MHSQTTVDGLRATATQAEEELRIAFLSENPADYPKLPALRAKRDDAKRALVEGEAQAERERVEAKKADDKVRAEEERAAAAVEQARIVAEQKAARASLDAKLAPLLAELAATSEGGRSANAAIASAEAERSRIDQDALVRRVLEDADRRPLIARTRGALAAECIRAAADNVAAVERHPSVAIAREQARALDVHAQLADDVEAARALAAGARALLRQVLARVASSPSPSLALAAIVLDYVSEEPIADFGGLIAAGWIGTGSTRKDALTLAARGAPVTSSAQMPIEEIGGLVLAGRVDEATVIATQRQQAAENTKLAAGVQGVRGSVAAAHGAVKVIIAARRGGTWVAPEEKCRDLVTEAAKFLAKQVMSLVSIQGTGRVFRVAVTPGGNPIVALPQLIKDDPARRSFTAPAPARDQIIAYLGLVGEVADLAELVPHLGQDVKAIEASPP